MARITIRGESTRRPKPRNKAFTEFERYHVLVSEWHPINCWEPDCFGPSSQEKVWWICSLTPEPHSFMATIASRTQAIDNDSKSRGCRVCNPKIRERASEPLSIELASEWLDKFNQWPSCYLTTRSIKLGKWQCSICKHQWRTKVVSRNGELAQGCPKCYTEACQDLTVNIRKHPKARALFDKGRERRNTGYDTRKLPMLYKVFWCCTLNQKHTWYENFSSLKERKWLCPKCASYLSQYPELAKEYPAKLNDNIEAKDLSIETNNKRRITWQCSKGNDHVWQARLIDRIRRSDGCPFCRGRKASHTNSLALYKDIAKELHPTQNGTLTAKTIAANSTKKVFWRGKCGHEWQTQVRLRTQRGYGCPKCKRKKNQQD